MTGTLLYIMAIILVLAWAIGYFANNAGEGIHVLLVLAFITLLLKVFQRNFAKN
jgi:uncharacterized membrane protein